jgi:hypothetical protein
MNESAVDSFQNAITDTLATFAGFIGFDLPITMTRLICLIANIPLFIGASILAANGTSILQAFLLGNMITTITFPALAAGLIPALNHVISSWSVILSCVASFFTLMGFGAMTYGDVATGLSSLFWSSNYDYRAFLIAFFSTVGYLIVFSGVELIVRKVAGLPRPGLPKYAHKGQDGDAKTGEYIVSNGQDQNATLVNY